MVAEAIPWSITRKGGKQSLHTIHPHTGMAVLHHPTLHSPQGLG